MPNKNMAPGSSMHPIKTGTQVLSDQDIQRNMSSISDNFRSIWNQMLELNRRITVLEEKK
jgi:hypothetical protein